MDIQIFHRELAGDQAREKVRVAHALKNLPKISDSFRQGHISFSKVRAMTRVATPETEEYLMMIARHGTAAHMEQLALYFSELVESCSWPTVKLNRCGMHFSTDPPNGNSQARRLLRCGTLKGNKPSCGTAPCTRRACKLSLLR